MSRVAAWAGTALFLPALGVILVAFEAIQRVARLFGTRPQEYAAGLLQVAIVGALRLSGTRLAVERAPGVGRDASYIVVSNHQSMLDIPILGTLLFWNFPKYVSKRSLARWIPSVSYNLRRGGHALIDRGDPAQALEAIRELGARVRRGGASAVIFPEGTRARVGDLGVFRRAGTVALLEAAPETPVLPVTIDESWRLLVHNMFPLPWGTVVRVAIGEPIARTPGESPDQVLDTVRAQMGATLARWRGGSDGEATSPPARLASSR